MIVNEAWPPRAALHRPTHSLLLLILKSNIDCFFTLGAYPHPPPVLGRGSGPVCNRDDTRSSLYALREVGNAVGNTVAKSRNALQVTEVDSYGRAALLRVQRGRRGRRGPEPRLAGDYVTQRDGGLTYRYDGSWFLAGERLVWRARIYRDGKFIALAHSDAEQADAEEPVASIKRAIASAIESLRYDLV
jgi:hypothetical protein